MEFPIWPIRFGSSAINRLIHCSGAAPVAEQAIARRKTDLPIERTTALTDGFLKEKGKASQWTGFLSRMQLPKDLADLDSVGSAIADFAMPVFEAARLESPPELEWPPKGPWKNRGA